MLLTIKTNSLIINFININIIKLCNTQAILSVIPSYNKKLYF